MSKSNFDAVLKNPNGPVKKMMTYTHGTKTINIPAILAKLRDDILKDAANVAIRRLQTMAGIDGIVVILSLSHTAILSTIEGKRATRPQQKQLAFGEMTGDRKRISRAPDSYGLTLKAVDCFTPAPTMNVHKLNFAGAGAISCVGPAGNHDVQIAEGDCYFDIFNIIHTNLLNRTATDTFESIASKMLSDIATNVRPLLEHKSKVDELVHLYKRYRRATNSKTAVNTVPLEKLNNLSAFGFQIDNLELGLGLQQHHVTESTCMFNKKYLRVIKNADEHYPALDWHVTAFDKAGNILVGNIFDSTKPNGHSTQIPPVVYDNLGDSWTPDDSWAMDLITVIKILTGNDLVTTKDILGLLNEKGIINVIFIDGGCNEFRDESKKIIIPCGQGDPALSIPCVGCNTLPPVHSRGGMKNKKTKTTKKKARIVRTVRGHRKMRKSYKRSKTYKR